MANDTTEFWAGQAGTEYHRRQDVTAQANFNYFLRATSHTGLPRRVLELGCGAGLNMAVLREIDPMVEVQGVDVNADALRQASEYGRTYRLSATDPNLPAIVPSAELVITKGLLIHIAPDDLPAVYANLYTLSDRYILIGEYYSPTPQEIEYRGQKGRLWKRDFAGELLDAYADLKLMDYGFHYHREAYPQDDISWFMLRKMGKSEIG